MLFTLEHQQALTNSPLLDNVQHAQKENLTVYQELLVTQMRAKNSRKRRKIKSSKKAEDARIRHRKGSQVDRRAQAGKLEAQSSPDSSRPEHEHSLDVII